MADDRLDVTLRICCDDESFTDPIAQIMGRAVFGVHGNSQWVDLVN